MKNKGITLIALIVTIIVLLILAGISIQMLTGDNGLLQKTVTAKQATDEATELELIKLAVTAAQTAGEGKLTEENLNNELRANFDDDDIDTNLKSISDYWNYKGYKIDNNGNVEKLLPKEYQQVEYIESTGTQNINTKVIPKVDLNGEFEIMSTGNGSYPFGSTNGQSQDYWGINLYRGNQSFECYFGTGSYPKVSKWHNETIYKISIVEKKFFCDDYLLYDFNNSSNSFNFNTAKPIFLFGLNYPNGEYNNYRFYSAKIWDSVGTIRYFIPCYSTTTVIDVNGKQCPKDTIGLYDTVEGKFYTNQGTGEFLKGNDV